MGLLGVLVLLSDCGTEDIRRTSRLTPAGIHAADDPQQLPRLASMANREHLARALWTLFEPIHAVTYFSKEARDAFAAIGLPRYWDGYFAGRSAPLGAVGAAPVVAVFSGFAPRLVGRALPAAWAIATPEQLIEARYAGAEATLRALVPSMTVVATAAAALAPVAGRVNTIGRPLSAANVALEPSRNPYRLLWQSAATLREHRGDGHVSALIGLDIAGLTTLVLRAGVDLDATSMQKARGWTDEEWAAETEVQIDRGMLDGAHRITDKGAAALAEAEHQTNRLAIGPWASLGDGELLDIARALAPISNAVGALFPYPNPIGMPVPWDPTGDPDAARIPEAPSA
jgi:hypothetical protein